MSRCSLSAVVFVPVFMAFSALFSVCGVALCVFRVVICRLLPCNRWLFALRYVAFRVLKDVLSAC